MKLTKSDLKQIVKECLVEILTEGVGSSLPAVNESTRSITRKKEIHPSLAPRQTTVRMKMPSSALKEAIKMEAGGNQMMASILADTAAKSLPAMLESDIPGKFSPSPSGAVEKIVASAAPEDLFGEETASKWASLAFADVPKK